VDRDEGEELVLRLLRHHPRDGRVGTGREVPMNTATLVVRWFTLAVAVTVAGCAGAGTGASDGDTLDVEAG
jgi:hypothetical protein